MRSDSGPNTLPGGERIVRERLGHQRLVVGYRDDDPRRWYLQGDIRGGVVIGRCVDCHHEVYGDHGARRCVIERDTQVGCYWCNEQFRDVEKVHQSGMVVQL